MLAPRGAVFPCYTNALQIPPQVLKCEGDQGQKELFDAKPLICCCYLGRLHHRRENRFVITFTGISFAVFKEEPNGPN